MSIEKNTQPAAAEEEQLKPREYPDFIQELLDMPPILPTEDIDDFLNIFESFDEAISAQNVLDYHLLFDITVLTFEVIRYRR